MCIRAFVREDHNIPPTKMRCHRVDVGKRKVGQFLLAVYVFFYQGEGILRIFYGPLFDNYTSILKSGIAPILGRFCLRFLWVFRC